MQQEMKRMLGRAVDPRALGAVVLLASVGCQAGGNQHAEPGMAAMQDEETAQIEQPTAPDDGLPDLAPIMAEVERIRGLAFTRPVPAEYQSVEDFGAYLTDELDAYFPPEKRDGMMQGLMRLGLIKEPIDLGEEMTEAMMSQAAAYYDPETGKFFYLMTDMPEMMLNGIAAHELVHALQDQHHSLQPRLEAIESDFLSGRRNDDAMLAFRFVVEGEATYVQMNWELEQMGMSLLDNPEAEAGAIGMVANMGLDALVQQAMAQAQALEEDNPLVQAMMDMKNIPPYILEPLYAAYLKGAYFCMALRHHGGWEALSGCYDDMPQSSEQVLHPEKYFDDRDHPTPLDLPDSALLRLNGFKPIDSSIHGELMLRLMFTQQGLLPEGAIAAAQGWDGDVYQAWRHEDGRVAIILLTTWDSDAEAAEFALAYRDILPNKYGAYEEVQAEDDSLTFHCSESRLDSGVVRRRGREVFVIEGLPRSLIDLVLEDLRMMRIRHVD